MTQCVLLLPKYFFYRRDQMTRKIASLLATSFLGIFILGGCANTIPSEVVLPQDTPAQTSPATYPAAPEVLQADIVVIGAGGAGMSAALQAYHNGATNVVIVEKMPMTGGNTVRATGGMNAAETPYQEPDSDSIELFISDTMTGGGYLNNEELVTIMATESAQAITWVNDLGADLTRVGRAGGASVNRVHGPVDGSAVGPALIMTLTNAVNQAGIPVLLNTEVTELLLNENGAIAGIVATRNGNPITIEATAVILAAGGFGANPEMLVYHDSNLLGFGTTNHAGATGSGILMAQDIGAALVDMEHIQTHPTVHPITSIMYTEAMRGDGAILVNTEGHRFVNELDTRDVVSEATLAQPDNVALLLFDSRTRDNLGVIESYINAGIITSGSSPAALAEELGIDPAILEETINNYNALVLAGEDTEHGRTGSLHVLEGPYFYAGVTAPAVHHTMGGVVINANAEVLKEDRGTYNRVVCRWRSCWWYPREQPFRG
jgi:fumarate reductase flavoprotein subunit